MTSTAASTAAMSIAEAQADVRRIYQGGAVGPWVSSAIWLIAAAVTTWGSEVAGAAALFLGGILIFPLTTLALTLLGGPAGLPKGHPMIALAALTAITVPIGLIVALWLLPQSPHIFTSAAMVIVGAHYLPFVFLYGMRVYAALAAVLCAGGVLIALAVPNPGPVAAWAGAGVLIVFGFIIRRACMRMAAPADDR
ncbi:DUF7010 family protein [Agrococcus sp. KRD186]|uniref:DUF7010 family protein n=1 Tax=Agrococcus sp. KRD186 TaxID=2729730 RepID=UPI0019D0AD90|nr:hypothetical protein [Agrococcus sp. KRD186]